MIFRDLTHIRDCNLRPRAAYIPPEESSEVENLIVEARDALDKADMKLKREAEGKIPMMARAMLVISSIFTWDNFMKLRSKGLSVGAKQAARIVVSSLLGKLVLRYPYLT